MKQYFYRVESNQKGRTYREEGIACGENFDEAMKNLLEDFCDFRKSTFNINKVELYDLNTKTYILKIKEEQSRIAESTDKKGE